MIAVSSNFTDLTMNGVSVMHRFVWFLSTELPCCFHFRRAVFIGSNSCAEDFNWASLSGQNWLTSVQNQNPTGDCWDFSACGALEAKYMLTRNDPLSSRTSPSNTSVGRRIPTWAAPVAARSTRHSTISQPRRRLGDGMPVHVLDTSPVLALGRRLGKSRLEEHLQFEFHRNERGRREDLPEDVRAAGGVHGLSQAIGIRAPAARATMRS